MSTTRLLCRLTLQIAFLFLLFRLGQWSVARFHLPVPGNVLGMLILFALLSAGLVRESWIHEATGLLTKHLAFFFVPIAVGLMEWGPLFHRLGQWLLLALMISTLAGLVAAGGLVHVVRPHLLRRGGLRWETPRSSPLP